MDEGALFLNLETMTVEDYALYRTFMHSGDYHSAVEVLDRYAGGQLLKRHWLNYDEAIEQAEAHFAMGRRVRDEAKAACAEANTAGVAWMGMVSRPKATWES